LRLNRLYLQLRVLPKAAANPTCSRGRTQVVYVRYEKSPTGWASISRDHSACHQLDGLEFRPDGRQTRSAEVARARTGQVLTIDGARTGSRVAIDAPAFRGGFPLFCTCGSQMHRQTFGRSVPDHLPYRLESGPSEVSKQVSPANVYQASGPPCRCAGAVMPRCQNCLHVLRGVLFTSTYCQWSNFSHTLSLRGRLASGFVNVA